MESLVISNRNSPAHSARQQTAATGCSQPASVEFIFHRGPRTCGTVRPRGTAPAIARKAPDGPTYVTSRQLLHWFTSRSRHSNTNDNKLFFFCYLYSPEEKNIFFLVQENPLGKRAWLTLLSAKEFILFFYFFCFLSGNGMKIFNELFLYQSIRKWSWLNACASFAGKGHQRTSLCSSQTEAETITNPTSFSTYLLLCIIGFKS